MQEHCHTKLLTIRQSLPFLALTGGSCSRTTKNWTNSAAQEISPPVSFQHDRNFSARQKPCPPEKPSATCYSPFTIRYSPVAAIFGFNWRVVLPHDQKLDEFGCSGDQPSSFVPARPKFFGTAEAVPSRKTIRYLLLAVHHSLFASRCHFWL
jgi:hypothetical protein